MSYDTTTFDKPTSVAPFFSYLMEKDERSCERFSFSNGEYIFQEGIRDDRVYLILKGKVEVGYVSGKSQWVDMGPFGMIDMKEGDGALHNARWLKKAILEEGDCLGELCCLHDSRHVLSARAVGEVQVLSVHGYLLKDLCANSADLVGCVEGFLSQAARRLATVRP